MRNPCKSRFVLEALNGFYRYLHMAMDVYITLPPTMDEILLKKPRDTY